MDPRRIVDAALEITVVGSFTSIGYAVRRRLHGWSEPVPGSLRGRTALVTGPTSAIGRATSEALAALGARIVLAGRSEDKLARVRGELSATVGEDRFATVQVDMSSLASVRSMVETVRSTEDRLDIVIDNAGAIMAERTVTDDGLEATFATMVAGPFAMVSGLLPLLSASPDGRVIAVVSGGMYAQALPLDDLQYERGDYDGTRAYARAKRAQTMIVREWSRRLGRHGPRVDAMHPGWADTPGLEHALPGFYGLVSPILRSMDQGIDTIVWLAASDEVPSRSGRLFLDRRPRPFDRVPATRLSASERAALFERVAEMAGVDDPLAGLRSASAEG